MLSQLEAYHIRIACDVVPIKGSSLISSLLSNVLDPGGPEPPNSREHCFQRVLLKVNKKLTSSLVGIGCAAVVAVCVTTGVSHIHISAR